MPALKAVSERRGLLLWPYYIQNIEKVRAIRVRDVQSEWPQKQRER